MRSLCRGNVPALLSISPWMRRSGALILSACWKGDDQFFTEQQFEAYRALGFAQAKKLTGHIGVRKLPRARKSAAPGTLATAPGAGSN